jgi:hypothetical protein
MSQMNTVQALTCILFLKIHLRHYATSRKVAGSIPNEVVGFSN